MDDYAQILKDAIEACGFWYRISRHLISCVNPECDVRRTAGLGMAVSDLTYNHDDGDIYEGCEWPDEDKDPFEFLDGEWEF